MLRADSGPSPAADGPAEILRLDMPTDGTAPQPVPALRVHTTQFTYTGDADPSAPGGIAAIYSDLAADDPDSQVPRDVPALAAARHGLVLTQWTGSSRPARCALRGNGHDPVILRGGMGAKARTARAPAWQPARTGPPLLVVATGPYIGEGFDCPALDTLFLAAPDRVQRPLGPLRSRILRPTPARPPPRSTTTTTSTPAFSPRRWPNAPLAMPASAFPTPAATLLSLGTRR